MYNNLQIKSSASASIKVPGWYAVQVSDTTLPTGSHEVQMLVKKNNSKG